MSPYVSGIQMSGVVAAFDGSPTSQVAVDWAADAAAVYGSPLTLLRAYPDAAAGLAELPLDSAEVAQVLGPEIADAVAAAVLRIRATHPELDLHFVVHPGSPVEALLDTSETAQVIAMGSRGLEGFRGLVLGSTTMHVAPRAKCPVVVLYQPDEDTAAAQAAARHRNGVVVGYDGSVSADLALVFALKHAEATDHEVYVVLATKGRPARAAEVVTEESDVPDDIRALIVQARQVLETHPDVPAEFLHGVGNPAGILIEEGSGASLAVVGARGRGGFAGLVLGSVGLQMLVHAECPVAIVHSAPSD